jgi:hypothetical protein
MRNIPPADKPQTELQKGTKMKPGRAMQMLRSTILAVMACATITFLGSGPAIADTPPTASAGVYAQHSGDKIVYYYRVINNTQQTIAAVTIGLDKRQDANPGNDVYELVELPSGWNSKFGIPSTSASSPTGWRAGLVAPEQQNTPHAISWAPMNDRIPKLLPGQNLGKMSISLDQPDDTYLTGHAMLSFSDGSPANLTVPLERLDTTPPRFTVILNPDTIMSQGDKLVAINASFSIKDDYDRMPEIKLVSITANEPLAQDDIRDASTGLDDRYFKLRATSKGLSGRIYTVTYSATDASGNQSMATANVRVTATPMSYRQGEAR